MKLKSVEQLKKLKGIRVLMRVDFNVKVGVNQEIGIHDERRIRAAFPTIVHLVEQGAKVVLIAHMGRPKGVEPHLSLLPAARLLEELLGQRVGFIDDGIDDGDKVDDKLAKMQNGDVVLLENLRFYPGEERNDPFFARRLASFGDVYVNDAFAVSHRDHASVTGVAEILPAYAGMLMLEEVRQLEYLIHTPKRPFVVLLGGAKIATKLPIIDNLLPKCDKILIGGGMANTFFKAMGMEMGKSLISKADIKHAKELLKKRKVILPLDVLVAKEAKQSAKVRVTTPDKIKRTEMVLDIGPETMRYYSQELKKAQTIVWNGPVGLFEIKKFSYGTLTLARVIAARSSGRAFGVVGGGDSLPALSMTKMDEFVDHISTGGGSMIALLGGKPMPALELLTTTHKKSQKKKAVARKPVAKKVAPVKKKAAAKKSTKKVATKKKVVKKISPKKVVKMKVVAKKRPAKKKVVVKKAVAKKKVVAKKPATKKKVAPKKKAVKKAPVKKVVKKKPVKKAKKPSLSKTVKKRRK